MKEEKKNILSMKHIGVYTKDFQTMVSFYKEALGLIELSNYVDSGIHLGAILKRENVRINICKLLTPHGKKSGMGDMVELIGLENNGELDMKREVYTPGISHIAFEADDIFCVVRSICSHGGQCIFGPVMINESGNYMAFCRDIEGNYLELIQKG